MLIVDDYKTKEELKKLQSIDDSKRRSAYEIFLCLSELCHFLAIISLLKIKSTYLLDNLFVS